MRHPGSMFYCPSPRIPAALITTGQTGLLNYSQFTGKVHILLFLLLCHLEGIPGVKLYCCSSFHSPYGLLLPCMSYIPLQEFTGLMHLI